MIDPNVIVRPDRTWAEGRVTLGQLRAAGKELAARGEKGPYLVRFSDVVPDDMPDGCDSAEVQMRMLPNFTSAQRMGTAFPREGEIGIVERFRLVADPMLAPGAWVISPESPNDIQISIVWMPAHAAPVLYEHFTYIPKNNITAQELAGILPLVSARSMTINNWRALGATARHFDLIEPSSFTGVSG